jgi:hypothetical protein
MKAEDTGTFWNSSDIEMVKLDGSWYTLDGWNGEKYTDCYRYADRKGMGRVDEEVYTIHPEYSQVGDPEDEQYEITGYEIE